MFAHHSYLMWNMTETVTPKFHNTDWVKIFLKSAILGIKLFASNDKIKDWEKKSVKVSPMKWWHKFLMWRLAQNFLALFLICRSLCNISTHKATKVMHDTSATKFSAKIATKIWDTTHYTIVICYKIAKKLLWIKIVLWTFKV